MKNRKSLMSLLLCFLTVLSALSVSSFASLIPFTPKFAKKNALLSSYTTDETDGTSAVSAERTAEISSAMSVLSPETAASTKPETTRDAVITETEESSTETAGEKIEKTVSAYSEETAAPMTSLKSTTVTASSEMTEIALNSETAGSLYLADSENNYTFTLTSRGVLNYSVAHEKRDGLYGWRVCLYQKYYANGFDGEAQWRLLNVLETVSGNVSDSSPDIGLQKGCYRICVSAGTDFTSEEYRLSVKFAQGTGYETECNNTVSRYTEIYSDIPVRGSASRLDGEYDTDWYMFRVYSASSVGLEFEHGAIKDSVSVYWKITLCNSDGKELFAMNSAATDTDLHSGELGLEPGCYFIAVSNRVYTSTGYRLTVTGNTSDSFETEPNGTTATADRLPLNSEIKGALISTSGGNDKDVFALTLTEPGILILGFTAASGTDTDYSHHITLADKKGRKIWESRVSPVSYTTESAKTGLAAGTYYITVDCTGLHGNNSTYILSNLFSPADNWEREFNGAQANATALSEGTGICGTAVNCITEYDDDWFVVNLSRAAKIKVTLEHEVIEGKKNIFVIGLLDSTGTPVRIENPDGSLQTSSDGSGVTEFKSNQNNKSVCGYYTLPEGRYYIKVSSGLFATDIQYLLTYTAVE